MAFLTFAGALLIIYGLLCFVAIDTVWRLSVPQHAQARIDRRKWRLITRLSGAFSVAIGLAILSTQIR